MKGLLIAGSIIVVSVAYAWNTPEVKRKRAEIAAMKAENKRAAEFNAKHC